ncbi:DUF3667 domain-containing protein [Croceitalea sp. P059]|uniref:DUF3667 domain-containing protein n=1 Tax=Croceitalea sp. P059 TaxID=3075601 RepID=UPI002883B778|nr:DUF3667 domain-containing protein [Croceitalea sp. P059]MDT0540414.1 DUF3667 domain-containing protein [Croceitalea sp. P059]
MNCKNCENSLRTDYSFCPDCGAKVIRNRITVKNLWYDAVERFFNVDNTFLITVLHLFTKPEKVIIGYIEGVRKKYLNPISYFTIAVTIGGLFLFLVQEFFPDALSFQFTQIDSETIKESDKIGLEFGKQFQELIFKYQGLFYILTLPILAAISRLVFINRKKYNFSEHFIINIYGYSHLSLCINIIYLGLMWNSKILYYIGLINVPIQILYFTYVFKRIFQLNLKQTLIKLIFFLFILGTLFFILMVLIALYMVFFTDIFQQMAPK